MNPYVPIALDHHSHALVVGQMIEDVASTYIISTRFFVKQKKHWQNHPSLSMHHTCEIGWHLPSAREVLLPSQLNILTSKVIYDLETCLFGNFFSTPNLFGDSLTGFVKNCVTMRRQLGQWVGMKMC